MRFKSKRKNRKEEFGINLENCTEGSVIGKIRCNKWDCTHFQELMWENGFERRDFNHHVTPIEWWPLTSDAGVSCYWKFIVCSRLEVVSDTKVL